MTEMTFKIEGLEDAMKALREAFPTAPKTQAKILSQSMRAAAKPTILKEAKMRAKEFGDSGALAESIGIRQASKRYIRTKGTVAAGIEIVPVRHNKKAIQMYFAKNYPSGAPARVLPYGIRHGHFVEWGVPSREIPARPFLWPAAEHGRAGYIARFADDLRVKIAANLKRAAKRRK